MKLQELLDESMLDESMLDESMLDKMRAMLGAVKGKIVSSMNSLLTLFNKNKNAKLTTIETFKIKEFSRDYEARVDTGALVCAIDAREIKIDEKANTVSFIHENKEYNMELLRVKDVTNANGVMSRARVNLTYEWDKKQYSSIETSLSDRSKLKFKLLIGRNLIMALKIPVHINDRDL